MRCFNNGTVPLSSSERTTKMTGQSLYIHQVRRYKDGKMQNYNGTICYDTSNNVKKMHSYDLMARLRRGYSDCSFNCSSTYGVPHPQTQWNWNTKMSLPSSANLVDVSCNYIEDSSCNLDFTFDSAGVANGFVKPAAGETSILDPDDVLFGAEDDCIKKKFMEHIVKTNSNPLDKGLYSGYPNDISARVTGKINLSFVPCNMYTGECGWNDEK